MIRRYCSTGTIRRREMYDGTAGWLMVFLLVVHYSTITIQCRPAHSCRPPAPLLISSTLGFTSLRTLLNDMFFSRGTIRFLNFLKFFWLVHHSSTFCIRRHSTGTIRIVIVPCNVMRKKYVPWYHINILLPTVIEHDILSLPLIVENLTNFWIFVFKSTREKLSINPYIPCSEALLQHRPLPEVPSSSAESSPHLGSPGFHHSLEASGLR